MLLSLPENIFREEPDAGAAMKKSLSMLLSNPRLCCAYTLLALAHLKAFHFPEKAQLCIDWELCLSFSAWFS